MTMNTDDIEFQNSLISAINEASPYGILVVDSTGVILSCNQRFGKIWKIPDKLLHGINTLSRHGVDEAPVISTALKRVADPDAFLARVKELYDNPELDDHCEIALLDGRTIERHSTVLRNPEGKYLGRVWFFRDIAEQKRSKQNLQLTQFASDHAPDSILWIDKQGRIIYANDTAARERGYTKAELLALSILDINPDITADGWHRNWESARQQNILNFEGRHRRKDGTIFPVEIAANYVSLDDREIVVAFARDITERQAKEDEIQHLAFHDPLTRLPNRRLLQDRLQHAIASSARNGRYCALLFIDLDNFKTLNDTLGHDIGDQLLQQVAKRLESCVREGDTVARIGGDEFILIMEDLSKHAGEAATQVRAASEKILASLRQHYQINQHECISTPSIGVTLFHGHQFPAEELMKRTDIAMYQSKRAGRNTLRFFDPDMQASILAYATLEKELHHAISAKQFRLQYQVQVDSSQHLLGVEALIRWMHPERGLIPPAQFITALEETGLILRVGHWLLDQACAQIKSWQQNALTRDLAISVNVSAKEFSQPGFAKQVRSAVKRHAVPPGLLKLELTESMLVSNIEGTVSTMNELNKIGVLLSLDDFGTGYSSLQYLRMLPLAQIKIDRSFVCDLAVDSNNRSIVQAIIAMARSLDLNIIAEGVETAEQRQILLDMGCTNFQGYLFGKPMPIEQIEAILHR